MLILLPDQLHKFIDILIFEIVQTEFLSRAKAEVREVFATVVPFCGKMKNTITIQSSNAQYDYQI